ncbi:MAG: hypothetical protein JNG90_00570, partial [Planctomycetaceae bacterium]|nr:hypothetical protein [Planctomycetaceae bacterium]
MLLFIHVAVSLVGIATGFVLMWGMLKSRPLNGWTAVFLATTLATSATGFLFPFQGVTPGIILGIISIPLLALAIYARYARGMQGAWRPVYLLSALVAQYLNVLVLIVQSFQKIGPLHDLAPNQNELPFVAAQLAALAAFLVIGALALKKFHP